MLSPLLAGVLLAAVVSANPIVIRDSPVTLPIARRFNFTGSSTILQRDQARAVHLQKKFTPSIEKRATVSSITVTNIVDTYIASIGVGSPAKQFNLLIDTGSSNTWVGAVPGSFVSTSTTAQTGDSVAVTYGSGSFSGTEVLDRVTIGSLVIPQQSIGVANTSTGFNGVDGIIGIGPVILTEDTLTGAGTSATTVIPTVTDNLFAQGSITSNLVAVSFNPTTTEEAANGELTFGGTDSTKFTGSITFVPKTTTQPASFFWGIDESISYGSTTILATTAGIVDTGTTLVLIASNAFTQYTRLTGATTDRNTGLLSVTSAQFAKLQNLNFNVQGATFSLTPNAQIFPRALNTAIGGRANSILLIVNSIGTPSGEGFDFVNGYTFLERFYSVFDTANNRVGFATTPNTNANTN